MPATLAIETATWRGGVAVVRDGAVLFEREFVSERSHNSRLFGPLGEALEIAGGDLARVVVGLGPGSYTGARVGIAAAQGVGLAREVPVFGLPSVLAPDVGGLPREFVVCGDARRGMFFLARVRRGLLEGAIALHGGEEFRRLRGLEPAGSWFTFDRAVPMGLAGVGLTSPSAAGLARIADAMGDESVWTLEREPLEPVYLAAPFVTKPKTG